MVEPEYVLAILESRNKPAPALVKDTPSPAITPLIDEGDEFVIESAPPVANLISLASKIAVLIVRLVKGVDPPTAAPKVVIPASLITKAYAPSTRLLRLIAFPVSVMFLARVTAPA